MLSGVPPFNDFSNDGIIQKIKRGKFSFEPKNIWSGISNDAKDFITCLLTKDPSKRPTAQEALNHKWIASSNVVNAHAEDVVAEE